MDIHFSHLDERHLQPLSVVSAVMKMLHLDRCKLSSSLRSLLKDLPDIAFEIQRFGVRSIGVLFQNDSVSKLTQ